MSSLAGQTFAGYEIIAKLGQGGMGAVFKARQPKLDRLAALKILAPDLASDPDFVARFRREAAAAASLSHPNIVQVYSAGESEGTHYIAMEFVDGQTLRDYIDQHGRLDPREAVAITVYVAEALQYAWNRAKLIHRDIKPENIFLSRTGEVKVGDLGLAKTVGGQTTSLTQTGTAMGSPHYISPEQATGAKEIDFRTDIYSLGGTLYHMLTGQTPYSGDSSMVVMMKHVNDPPPAIFKVWPSCPMPLGLLVGKMLAKNRNSRPASYEDLIEQLRELHDRLKPATVPAAAPVHPSDPTQLLTPPPKPAAATPAPKRAAAKTPKPTLVKSRAQSQKSKVLIGVGALAAVALIAGAMWWFAGRAGEGVGGTKVLNLGGGVKMELVAIPPGEFLFGNNPPRKTAIREQFWLGRTEVTVGQWKQFVAATGYQSSAEKKGYAHWCPQGPGKGTVGAGSKGTHWRTLNVGFPLQDNHPVACISWDDAMAFCEWLTERERKAGRLRAGYVLRLPTEAEWEYACRAGTTTKFWWGDDVNDGEGRVNWGGTEDGFEFMSPVDHYGERGRNRLGLADMLGNVAELCLDCFDAGLTNEQPSGGTPLRACRGGSFSPGRHDCFTCSKKPRSDFPAGVDGFRVCLGPDVLGSAASAPVATAESRVASTADAPGFVSLFNGKDLTGWEGRPEFWSVQDGAICGATTKEARALKNTFLVCTAGEFGDFELHAQFKLAAGDEHVVVNTGVQYRSQIVDQEYFTLSGYQADLGFMGKKNLSGGFWEEGGRRVLSEPGQRLILREGASPKSPQKTVESIGSADDIMASYKEDDWNDLVIIASGNRLQHYLNGKLASEVIDETAAAAKTGTLALQIKAGPPMRVWFRNLFIKKLGSDASTTSPLQSSAAPASADAGWENAINLLPLIDPQKDAVQGDWRIEKGDLLSDKVMNFSRIEFPYRPPAEYDLRVTFTRLAGTGTPNVILTQPGLQFIWVMDGFTNHMFGFCLFDGMKTGKSASSVKRSSGLENGRRYTTTILVRNGQLQAYLDDELIVKWSGDMTRFSNDPKSKLQHDDTLGIHTYGASVAIHKVEVREVTGKGTFTRGAPAFTDADWQNAINLLPLIDPQKDAVAGTWTFQNEALAVGNTPFERLELPYEPPEEYDFRIVFTRLDGVEGITQVLTKSGNPFAWCVGFNRNSVAAFGMINGVTGGDSKNPSRARRDAWIENGRPYTMVVAVRNDGLKAFLNDELISQWKTDYRDMGMFSKWRLRDPKRLGVASSDGRVLFHRIEVCEVTGKGKLLRKPSN